MTKSTGVGRGGARPGAGRKPKPKREPRPVPEPATATVSDVGELARAHTALAVQMLAEIALNGEREAARVAAANALLDWGHVKTAAPEGKKAQRQAAAEASSAAGRFAVPSGPKLAVDNSR